MGGGLCIHPFSLTFEFECHFMLSTGSSLTAAVIYLQSSCVISSQASSVSSLSQRRANASASAFAHLHQAHLSTALKPSPALDCFAIVANPSDA